MRAKDLIKEIDPSRSPWTQSGKHPGAMNREELEKEIAVFDELRARGDHLSPRELAQEDSLHHYLDQTNEGHYKMPSVDKEKYGDRSAEGLEGPFQTVVGKVVYYDPKEGKYYDPDTDIYLSHEEWKALDGLNMDPSSGNRNKPTSEHWSQEEEEAYMDGLDLMAKYKENEKNNYHSENDLLLAKSFGTDKEVQMMELIIKKNKRQGHTSPEDSKWMYDNINKKYYPKLVQASLEDDYNEGIVGAIGQGIDNLAVGAGKLAWKGAKKAAPHIKKGAKAGAKLAYKGAKKGAKLAYKGAKKGADAISNIGSVKTTTVMNSIFDETWGMEEDEASNLYHDNVKKVGQKNYNDYKGIQLGNLEKQLNQVLKTLLSLTDIEDKDNSSDMVNDLRNMHGALSDLQDAHKSAYEKLGIGRHRKENVDEVEVDDIQQDPKDVKLKGGVSPQMLVKQFPGVADKQQLLQAIMKMKRGDKTFSRNQMIAAADAFKELLAKDPLETQRMMMLLKRIGADDDKK